MAIDMLCEKMQHFFLTKNQLNTLATADLFLSRQSLSIDDIAVSLDITRREARIAIMSLIEAVSDDALMAKGVVITRDEHYFKISNSETNESVAVLLRHLTTQYFQESSLYQSLMFLIEKRQTTVVEMADKMNYSRSNVYKVLQKVNRFFDYMELTISLTLENQALIICGNEAEIRVLQYYLCLYAAHYDIGGNIVNQPGERPFGQQLGSSDAAKYQILRLLYRRSFHSKNKIGTVKLKEGFAAIQAVMQERFSQKNTLFQQTQYPDFLTEEQQHNQDFYELLACITMPESIKMVDKSAIGEKFWSFQELKVARSCRGVIETLIQKHLLDEEQRYYLMYRFVIDYFAIIYLSMHKFLDQLHLGDFFQTKQGSGVLEGAGNRFPWLRNDQKTILQQHFTSIITPFLIETIQDPIKVYAEFFFTLDGKLVLDTWMKKVYGNNVKLVPEAGEAEVVISDNLLLKRNGQQFFYLPDIDRVELLMKLSLFLKRELSQKRLGTQKANVSNS